MARFRAVLAVEDVDTADGRRIAPGALSWRDLPLTLMAALTTEMVPHGGAFIAGRIESVTREAGGRIVAEGEYDTSEQAMEVERLVGEGTVRGVSIDVGDAVVEYDDVYDESGELAESTELLIQGTILAATVTPMPALADAMIENVGATDAPETPEAAPSDPEDAAPAAGASDHPPGATPPVDAPGVAATANPPLWWFDDPHLDGPTPLTVTADGRVFGHIAAWGGCHTGFPDQCRQPPRSHAGYAWFRLGAVLTAEGVEVPVGTVSMDTGHADLRSSYSDTIRHYDDTGTAAAYVAAGEDTHGIWIAGTVAPGLDAAQIARLRAAKPSGDWRRMDGHLELGAVLACNVPGFPVMRHAVAATASAGAPAHASLALVAVGVVDPDAAVRAAAARARHAIGVGAATAPAYRRLRLARAADAVRRVA